MELLKKLLETTVIGVSYMHKVQSPNNSPRMSNMLHNMYTLHISYAICYKSYNRHMCFFLFQTLTWQEITSCKFEWVYETVLYDTISV